MSLSPEERQKSIDNLRFIQHNGISIDNKFVRKYTNSTKFRTKKWVEKNALSSGMYKSNSQIKFRTSILKLSLCNYSDAYILVSGTVTINREGDDDAKRANERNLNSKI